MGLKNKILLSHSDLTQHIQFSIINAMKTNAPHFPHGVLDMQYLLMLCLKILIALIAFWCICLEK